MYTTWMVETQFYREYSTRKEKAGHVSMVYVYSRENIACSAKESRERGQSVELAKDIQRYGIPAERT